MNREIASPLYMQRIIYKSQSDIVKITKTESVFY